MSQEWTEMVARRLVTTIGQEVPKGIGRWPRAWEMVEAPSRAFLDVLDRYERGEGDRETVVRAGVAVRDAWRAAAWEFELQRTV